MGVTIRNDRWVKNNLDESKNVLKKQANLLRYLELKICCGWLMVKDQWLASKLGKTTRHLRKEENTLWRNC